MFLRLVALLVKSFADWICLPRRCAVRNLLWLGIASMWILVATAGVLHAHSVGPELSIPRVKASVGGSVNVTVGFAGHGAGVAALQFDLRYDRSVFTITATPGDAMIGAGKSLATSDLPSGATRFVITGFNQSVTAAGGWSI